MDRAADELTDVATTGPAGGDQRFGRRTLFAGTAGVAIGAAASSLLGGSAVDAATPLSVFEPTVPSLRLTDTRAEYGAYGFTRVNANTIRVVVAGRRVGTAQVPSDAVAAVLSVAAINVTPDRNFITAYPSRTSRPTTANANLAGLGDLVNNLVTVKLGSDGALELFSRVGSELIVDLAGVYRPAGGPTRAGRFETLGGIGGSGPSAQRIFSPESSGVPRDGQVVDIDVESLISSGLIEGDAIAVAANLAVARPGRRGFVVAYPYGEPQPDTSSLNYLPGSVRSNNSIVRLGRNPRTGRRGFHIFVSRSAPLYVDVSGFFTGANAKFSTTSGQFTAITPTRILDTRARAAAVRGVGGGKRLWPGWTRQFGLPASVAPDAGAVAVNLTIVDAMGPGFVTLFPARTARQLVSNGNAFYAGQIVGNHNIVRAGTEGLEVFSRGGASMVCDLVGYFKGSGASPTLNPVPDPPPPPIGGPYTLSMPRLGKTREMKSGNAWLVDSGRIWHWTGTGMVGQGAMIGAFGHRTDAGGPLRNLHWLGEGDVVTLDTVDQRRYYYRYVGRDITNSSNSRILAASAAYPGEVLSLIACTVGYDRAKGYPGVSAWAPTSLKYRIIVRMALIGWDDTSPTPF